MYARHENEWAGRFLSVDQFQAMSLQLGATRRTGVNTVNISLTHSASDPGDPRDRSDNKKYLP
jgi:hypothetical protein